MSTFIDQLAHIQSCVRNGEKWEFEATNAIDEPTWYEPVDASVESLNIFAQRGFKLRLTPKEDHEMEKLRSDYNELIMAVGSKFPDETRHKTALRYINEAEAPSISGPHCTLAPKPACTVEEK